MKGKIILVVVVAVVSALLFGASQFRGVQADDAHGCSNATLNGSYGFWGTGVTPDGPYAAVGTLVFDGKESVNRVQAVSRNGFFERNHVSFKYSVANNCTGKSLAMGKEFQTFVVTDDGKEIYLLKEEGDQTVYLIGKKIHTN